MMWTPLCGVYEVCNRYLAVLPRLSYDGIDSYAMKAVVWCCNMMWFRVHSVAVAILLCVNSSLFFEPEFILTNLSILWRNELSWYDMGKVNLCFLAVFGLGTFAPLLAAMTSLEWVYNTLHAYDNIVHFRLRGLETIRSH